MTIASYLLENERYHFNIPAMKKNILITVFLTTTFFYGYSQQPNELLEMGLSFDLEMQHETLESKSIGTDFEAVPEMFVPIDLVLSGIPIEKSSGYAYAPKFLSSLYLYDFSKGNSSRTSPSNPSSKAMAFHITTENTFFPWMNAVDYGDRNLHSLQQIPKGFGPLISI